MVSLSEQKKSRIARNAAGSVVVTIMLLGCKYRFVTEDCLKARRFQTQTIPSVNAVLILGTAAVIQIKEVFSGGTKMVRYTTGKKLSGWGGSC